MIPPRALAAVPGCGPGAAPPRITPLAGGLLNRAFRVDSEAGTFVLRLNAPAAAAAALGVDRRVELEAQRLAAAHGLAPWVVATGADHAFQVTRFVRGEPATAARLATTEGLERLGTTLQRLRAIVPTAALRGASLIERARRLVRLALTGAPGDTMALEAALARAEAGWRAAGEGHGPACLVHSDPNPGNVLFPPDLGTALGPVLLLDWEYAHLGDPLQDLAAWLQACPALRGREADVLRACGLARRADPAMLSGMVAVYAALDFAWGRVVENVAGIPHEPRAN